MRCCAIFLGPKFRLPKSLQTHSLKKLIVSNCCRDKGFFFKKSFCHEFVSENGFLPLPLSFDKKVLTKDGRWNFCQIWQKRLGSFGQTVCFVWCFWTKDSNVNEMKFQDWTFFHAFIYGEREKPRASKLSYRPKAMKSQSPSLKKLAPSSLARLMIIALLFALFTAHFRRLRKKKTKWKLVLWSQRFFLMPARVK